MPSLKYLDLKSVPCPFNILMGDKVAPRREFIETHSSNLDMAALDI